MKKILEVEPGVECAVLGTLYKDMKLKPSVLDEYKKDAVLRPHLVGAKFVSKDDSLVMEVCISAGHKCKAQKKKQLRIFFFFFFFFLFYQPHPLNCKFVY